ncbi:MAG: 3-phosphoserine/phosphohydroxythreonine transaminase [Candidatus Muiribacteriota bacterium]
MTERIYNFSAGPATLPESVLKEAQENMLNWKGKGLSVMEMSHRSPEFDSIAKDAEARLVKLLNVPDTHKVLFLQGGANTQFAMVPLNILGDDEEADYIITGNWARKAYKEVEKIGKKANVVASSEDDNFSYIPARDEWKLSLSSRYVHYCSNNTIFGTRFLELPDFDDKITVCDMSSDFLSRPFDVSKFGVVYAGAQKNAGPAGVTIVIVRKDLVENIKTENLPTMLRYKTHVDKDSLYNTPPSYSMYICGLVFKWIEEEIGGLEKMHEYNKKKAGLLYKAIEKSDGFYKGTVKNKDDRSLMNVTFTLPNPELDKKFIEEAKKLKIYGIKGYRTVGGIRASIYNAHPLEGVETLADFMDEFHKRNMSEVCGYR